MKGSNGPSYVQRRGDPGRGARPWLAADGGGGHGVVLDPRSDELGAPKNILIVLIPVSVALRAARLAARLWTLRNGQFEGLEGDAVRILLE